MAVAGTRNPQHTSTVRARRAARAGTPPRRRSTSPQVAPVSGREFLAAKAEGLEEPEDTRTRLERGQDELAYERDYRRGRGRQRAATGRGRPLVQRPAPVVGVSVDDGAGFLLGLLAWVVTVQYLRGGMPGVKSWLRAKFLNQTSGGRP